MRIAQVAAAPSPYLSRGAYALVQEELDFALEIFKVAYTKRQFDGPYVFTFFALLHRRSRPTPPPQLRCNISCRHSLALRALDHVIESPRLTDEAKLAALPTITLQFVHDTTLRFVREAFVTSFACGSVTSEMAASFCRQLTSFKTPSSESVFHHCFCTSYAHAIAACSSSSSTLQPMHQARCLPTPLPLPSRSLPPELGHLCQKIASQSGASSVFLFALACQRVHVASRCLHVTRALDAISCLSPPTRSICTAAPLTSPAGIHRLASGPVLC